MTSILLIDDEKNIRDLAAIVLRKHGYEVTAVDGGTAALQELTKNQFQLALVDYMMPEMDGLELLAEISKYLDGPPPCVFMTAYGSVDTAVRAMRAGAVDYLAKPFTSDELLHTVQRNLRTGQLERKIADLESQVKLTHAQSTAGISTANPAMIQLLSTAGQVASSAVPVLIEGETGTGKERLARFIHEASPRASHPFIAVNCGALHPELLLSELFGHKRGAFTGAVEDRVGRFESANHGTLFLDEIGELDLAAQVKLLRVLQEGSFERVGDPRTIRVDVRIVAATNRRLSEMIADESFRSDLYYRLAVITLRIPALRERTEDIANLADEFALEFATEANRPKLHFAPESYRQLSAQRWLGNIRELRNFVQRAVILTSLGSDTIAMEEELRPALDNISATPLDLESFAISEYTFEELEAAYLKALLSRTDLKQTDLCRILQIDASTLWRKRKKYNL